SSDPDLTSESIAIGDGVIVRDANSRGSCSYGEFGKSYRNNRVSFRIIRAIGDRYCKLSFENEYGQLNAELYDFIDHIKFLKENKTKFDFSYERVINKLNLQFSINTDEFEKLFSYIKNNCNDEILINCRFHKNSAIFIKNRRVGFQYDNDSHFKIMTYDWDEKFRLQMIDYFINTKHFSFNLYQSLKGQNKNKFDVVKIYHFPILKQILYKRKHNIKLRFRILIQKIGNFFDELNK
ncbi:hypothetical protein, partial [Sphingorhabdus sp.]|uniref:hypothetical protein n=1 Tax=Sphingorhabdus sp. TaxID=1902408 RepID=UPI0038FCE0DD